MISRCSLSRNKWSHDDYSDIRQVQKDRWRSPTRDTDEGNHPRCTTWIPLRHAGYGAFLPVWYLENNVRDISVVLWSNFTVIIRGWKKMLRSSLLGKRPVHLREWISGWPFACRLTRFRAAFWVIFRRSSCSAMLIAIMGSIIQKNHYPWISVDTKYY